MTARGRTRHGAPRGISRVRRISIGFAVESVRFILCHLFTENRNRHIITLYLFAIRFRWSGTSPRCALAPVDQSYVVVAEFPALFTFSPPHYSTYGWFALVRWFLVTNCSMPHSSHSIPRRAARAAASALRSQQRCKQAHDAPLPVTCARQSAHVLEHALVAIDGRRRPRWRYICLDRLDVELTRTEESRCAPLALLGALEEWAATR